MKAVKIRYLLILALFVFASTFCIPVLAKPYVPPSVDAAIVQQILALLNRCHRISKGLYRKDAAAPPTIPICQLNGAVFWKADMDIDCDGTVTKVCNRTTDPWFQADTAAHTATGKPLNAARVPYVVIPRESPIFRYTDHQIVLGAVVAVIYKNRLQYAVLGDTGPANIIGEGSYALAQKLGIDPDPKTGGVDDGVSYIVFQGSLVHPIEDRSKTVTMGKQLTKRLILENEGYSFER